MRKKGELEKYKESSSRVQERISVRVMKLRPESLLIFFFILFYFRLIFYFGI